MRPSSSGGRIARVISGGLAGRARARVTACLLGSVLAGCALNPGDHESTNPAPVVDRDATSAILLASHVEVLQRLVQAAPAEQAEMLEAAHRDFTLAPTPSHQLRYALELAAPGHAGTNLLEAQRLLREVVAAPESLVSSERALAYLELQQVDAQLTLTVENRTLQDGAAHAAHDRAVAANKQLQSEIDENSKLRKDLEEARAKLNAITNIESSVSDRKPSTEGHSP
jgi:hypothetical protein